MSRSATLWEQVAQLLDSGRAPRVTLPAGAEHKPPKRAPGRPRVRDEYNPFAHYATSTAGHRRPRCLTCKRRLRARDVEVCSEACRAEAERWMADKLSRIHRPEPTQGDVADYYDRRER